MEIKPLITYNSSCIYNYSISTLLDNHMSNIVKSEIQCSNNSAPKPKTFKKEKEKKNTHTHTESACETELAESRKQDGIFIGKQQSKQPHEFNFSPRIKLNNNYRKKTPKTMTTKKKKNEQAKAVNRVVSHKLQ